MIRDYQAIQKTWFLRGKQRIIPTTGKHRGVKLLATVDYEAGRIVWQEDEQYTSDNLFDISSEGSFCLPCGKHRHRIRQRPNSSCEAAATFSGRTERSALTGVSAAVQS